MDKEITILVVDDEEDIRDILSARLRNENMRVFTAENGSMTLKLMQSIKPDLVLLDIMMPPPNGYQICKMIKQEPRYQSIPVVFLTAKDKDTDKFWGKESGADAYLAKPYTTEELLATIRKLIKNPG